MKIRHLSLVILSPIWAQDFFLKDLAIAKSTPQFAVTHDTTLAQGQSSNKIQIQGSTIIAAISPNLFGNNANAYMGKELLSHKSALQNLRNTGMKHMRLPGGNWSNVWFWDSQTPTGLNSAYLSQIKSAPIVNWTLKTEDLYSLADSIGAQLQPCVNYSISRYFQGKDSVQKAASYAANWVRSVKTQNRKAPYWEVGNENYGKWQSGFIVNGDTLDGNEYGRDFRIFADSMKAADPTIKVGAVIYPEALDFRKWSAKVLPELQGKADFLIIHEYFTYKPNINDVTASEVLQSLKLIKADRDSINAMINQYTSQTPADLPIMVSEYNLRCGTKEMTFLAPIFQTLALQEFAKNNFWHVNLWDIANAYSTDGDHGMLSRQNPKLPNYTPNPGFYGYWLSQKWMGDAMISNQSSDTTVRWNTTRFSDGNQGFIAVNPNSNSVIFNIESDLKYDQIQWQIMSADSLLSTQLSINGIKSNLGYPGPENYESIAPFKADFDPQKTITVPPYSAIYGVLTSKSNTPIGIKPSSISLIHGILDLPNWGQTQVRIINSQGKILTDFAPNQRFTDLSQIRINQGNFFLTVCSKENTSCQTLNLSLP